MKYTGDHLHISPRESEMLDRISYPTFRTLGGADLVSAYSLAKNCRRAAAAVEGVDSGQEEVACEVFVFKQRMDSFRDLLHYVVCDEEAWPIFPPPDAAITLERPASTQGSDLLPLDPRYAGDLYLAKVALQQIWGEQYRSVLN